MKIKRFILFFWALIVIKANAQQVLTGKVFEKIKENSHTHFQPLAGASVYWKDTQIGTITNDKGFFKIKKTEQTQYLVVSFVGYKSDTIRIAEGQKEVNIVLESIQTLSEIEVVERQKGEYIDKMNPIKTEIITTTGLQKLACCNLSESFENSGTVDVNYSDAITGAKHIQMLGLAGIYSQLLGENMPLLNYLSYSHGLTFVPGTWMQSIQVSKGTASVVNGYESITGQINVEFKKPHVSDPFFVNLYANSEGRTEANADVNFFINERLSAGTLIHTENQFATLDHNKDGFLDLPLSRQINVFQRFNYEKDEKLCFQYGVKVLYDDKKGGQRNYNFSLNPDEQNAYGIGITNKRLEFLSKHGFILPRHATSIGIQLSGIFHEQDNFFGKQKYLANEKFLYTNIIYDTYIFNDNHKISTGTSFTFSDLQESFAIKGIDTNWQRNNHIPGLFFQYTYDYQKVFTLIAGIRSDYSTLYNYLFFTPRFHLKYELNENNSLRLSAGKGTRFSYPVAENTNYLVSSRIWSIQTNNFTEQAWNFGVSFSSKIKTGKEKFLHIIADAYRTHFTKQVVIDFITHPQKLSIYSLNGKSHSNSYQLNVSYTPVKSLELTLIGRYNDVMQTYEGSKVLIKPMVVPLKILFTASYSTRFDKWSFDLTNQWNSATKLPDLSFNPANYRIPVNSDPFTIIHFQITRRFKSWDIYAGVENMLDYKLNHPIIAHDDPFGTFFDASLVYAPIMGRLFYAGLRFKIPKK